MRSRNAKIFQHRCTTGCLTVHASAVKTSVRIAPLRGGALPLPARIVDASRTACAKRAPCSSQPGAARHTDLPVISILPATAIVTLTLCSPAFARYAISSSPMTHLSSIAQRLTQSRSAMIAEYDGLRVRLSAMLGTARIPLQIDVGFGNAIEPSRLTLNTRPSLTAEPRIRAYPHEAVIAEKFHAWSGSASETAGSRTFTTCTFLPREFHSRRALRAAIAATFERRNTPIDAALPAALAPRFYADIARSTQWRTYLERNHLPGAPADFVVAGELIRQFLGPVWSALAENMTFRSRWRSGGAWNSDDVENKILAAPSAPANPTSHGQQNSDSAETVVSKISKYQSQHLSADSNRILLTKTLVLSGSERFQGIGK